MRKQYNIKEKNKNFASDMQMCEHIEIMNYYGRRCDQCENKN